MQQPLAYIFQTLFQHEIFVITSTLTERRLARIAHAMLVMGSWQRDNCFFINFLYKTAKSI
jgi:hypothetical protein